MMLLTGAAAMLWILAQVEPSIAGRDWIWLLIIVVLTAWPSYGAWCSHQATRKRLADLEHRCTTMYSTGYANGYLDALSAAPAEPATDQVSP